MSASLVTGRARRCAGLGDRIAIAEEAPVHGLHDLWVVVRARDLTGAGHVGVEPAQAQVRPVQSVEGKIVGELCPGAVVLAGGAAGKGRAGPG